jgi:hypothetical protein
VCTHQLSRLQWRPIFVNSLCNDLTIRYCSKREQSIPVTTGKKTTTNIPFGIVLEGRSQWPRSLSLRPLACWDCGFESHRLHGYLSVVSVVCCQVEVSATNWSLVQRCPTECGASLCVINNLVNDEVKVHWGGYQAKNNYFGILTQKFRCSLLSKP